MAVESLAPRSPPDLRQRRVALLSRPGSFRREFAAAWRAALAPAAAREVDTTGESWRTASWDVGFVEVDHRAGAALLAARPPRSPEKIYAVAAANLPRELRAALHGHFQLVLNKPLHHDALPYLIASSR